MKVERADVLGVGAGIAGLACARALRASGARVVVLERSAGVGGRCATRRVDGQPVDHGISFFHGADARFVEALRSVDSASAEHWPTRLSGSGTPCHPDAFREGQCCFAYADGVTAFPKQLARNLDVRLRSDVCRIERTNDGWCAFTEGGSAFTARHLVLTPPVESVRTLLATMDASREVDRAVGLLSLAGTVPCLTAIAGYPADAPEPAWHVAYPEASTMLQVASHDSSKRLAPRTRVLVLQARPAWSNEHLAEDPASWGATLLEEAARLFGAWIRRPAWLQTHAWRRARISPAETFAGPVVLPFHRAGFLGLAGEAFDAAAGAEGAFLSGLALARALSAEA